MVSQRVRPDSLPWELVFWGMDWGRLFCETVTNADKLQVSAMEVYSII